MLLGLLTGSERQFAPRSSTVTSKEPFNILPLASSQVRWVELQRFWFRSNEFYDVIL